MQSLTLALTLPPGQIECPVEESTVLDRSKGQELLLKEALHIQMTPLEERFNQDGGLEVPGCWITVMRRQGGRSNPHRPLISNDVYPQWCINSNVLFTPSSLSP